MHDSDSETRRIATVIRDVCAGQRFEDFADFKDALRRRLARLRIPYEPAAFDDAITVVASNRGLWGTPAPRKVEEHPPEPVILDRETAARVYRELIERWRAR